MYGVLTTSTAKTLKNCPVANAGRLEVWCSTGATPMTIAYAYRIQRYTQYEGRGVWMRHAFTNAIGAWSFWPWAEEQIVLEAGSSGMWDYKKYTDGTAECWGEYYGTVSLTSNYSGCWYTPSIVIPFPFQFASSPNLQVNGGSHNCINWARRFVWSRDNASFIIIAEEKQTEVSIVVSLYAKGNY